MNSSNIIEYQPLPSSYKDHSMTFYLVQRVGDVAMFAAGVEGQEPMEWEVMVVQKQKASTFPNGKSYPPKEKVPSPEQWGTHGWTYTTQGPAHHRFAMLVEREQKAQRASAVSPV